MPSFCLQVLHRLEVRVNRGAEGKSGKVFVGDLSEENALELAGKVISESFLWLVSPSRPRTLASQIGRQGEDGPLAGLPSVMTLCAGHPSH